MTIKNRLLALETRRAGGVVVVEFCSRCGSTIVRGTGPCPVHREAPPASLQDITIERRYGAEARP